jgi:hypothetical protein
MADIQPKVVQGATILLSDYNNIQTKIARVMGTGDGQFGYGQTVASSQVAANSVIDDAHWDNLRTDLVKARSHQSTSEFELFNADAGGLIDDVDITAYETAATDATTQRLTSGAGRGTSQTAVSKTSAVWNGTLQCTVTLDCGTANKARWFFNSRGQIRVEVSMPGTFTAGTKDKIWQDMINGNTSIVFSSGSLFTDTSRGFYSLTSTYQNLTTKSAAAGVYVENRFFVDASVDVADNTNGGARFVYIRLRFADNDVGDQTGTGPAVDENVSAVTVSAFTTTARNEYVSVEIPTVTVSDFTNV